SAPSVSSMSRLVSWARRDGGNARDRTSERLNIHAARDHMAILPIRSCPFLLDRPGSVACQSTPGLSHVFRGYDPQVLRRTVRVNGPGSRRDRAVPDAGCVPG